MTRREAFAGTFALLGAAVVGGCGAVLIPLAAIAEALSALGKLIRRLGTPDGDIEKEIQDLKAKISRLPVRNGKARMTKAQSDRFGEEYEKIKGKHDSIEEVLEEVEDKYEDAVVEDG